MHSYFWTYVRSRVGVIPSCFLYRSRTYKWGRHNPRINVQPKVLCSCGVREILLGMLCDRQSCCCFCFVVVIVFVCVHLCMHACMWVYACIDLYLCVIFCNWNHLNSIPQSELTGLCIKGGYAAVKVVICVNGAYFYIYSL